MISAWYRRWVGSECLLIVFLLLLPTMETRDRRIADHLIDAEIKGTRDAPSMVEARRKFAERIASYRRMCGGWWRSSIRFNGKGMTIRPRWYVKAWQFVRKNPRQIAISCLLAVAVVIFCHVLGMEWSFIGIGASFTSKASGGWDTEGATTWNEAGHPVAGDGVSIGAGHAITGESATACATLTIAATGSMNTTGSNWSLTISGQTSITGTLVCNGSPVSLGSAYIPASGYAVTITGTGVLTGGTGPHTYGSIANSNVWSQTTGGTTLNSASSSGFAISNAQTVTGMTHNNSTITFTQASVDCAILIGTSTSTLGIYNLVINTSGTSEVQFYQSSANAKIYNNVTLTTTGSKGLAMRSIGSTYTVTFGGNLVITSGLLTTTSQYGGPTNLTVTGTSSITGTLTPNASTCIFNGTVIVNSGGNIGGAAASAWNGDFNDNLTVSSGGSFRNPNGAGSTLFSGATLVILGTYYSGIGSVDFTFDRAGTTTLGSDFTLLSDFTISAGTILDTSSSGNYTLIADGYSTINGTLIPNASAITFASVTINSGGILTGSAGCNIHLYTTTINNGGTLGGNAAYTLNVDASMTINTGGELSAPNASGSFTFSGTTLTVAGTFTSNTTTMIWDGSGAQSNSGAFTVSFIRISNSAIATLTSVTVSGTESTAWNQKHIQVSTGGAVQLATCTFTSIGMQATSGWALKRDASSNYTVYGILTSESASSGWRAANLTGTVTTKQATAYGTSFNTTYTLGANATSVQDLTVDASTTISTGASNYSLTCTLMDIVGTLTPNASTVTVNGACTIDGTVTGNTAAVWDLNGNFWITGTFGSPSASGSVSMSGEVWNNEGTYTNNGGSVNFDRAGDQLIHHNGQTFAGIIASGSGTKTFDETVDSYSWLQIYSGVTVSGLPQENLITISNLKLYSNAACTTVASDLEPGATGYISGDIVLSGDYSTVAVKVEVCLASDDSVVATPLDTTWDFDPSTSQNIKTDICSGTAPSFDTTGYTAGEHYLKLTVTIPNAIGSQTDSEYFDINVVTFTSDNLTAYSNAACTTVSSVYADGSTVYINGSLASTGTKAGVTVKLEIRKSSDDSLIATPLNTTYSFTGGVAASIKTINGGNAPTFDTTGAVEGEYYVKLTLSVTGATTLYDYEDFYIDIPVRITGQTHNCPSPYSLAWHETVTPSATVTWGGATNGNVFAKVNGKAFLMSASGSVYSVAIKGSEIGICTSQTIYIYAGAQDAEGDYAVCANPITVTAPSGREANFKQTLTVEPFAAEGDYGPSDRTYGTAYEIPCMIAQKNVIVTNEAGEEMVSSTQIYISGIRTITAKDRITLPDGTKPVILSVESYPDSSGSSEIKVVFT